MTRVISGAVLVVVIGGTAWYAPSVWLLALALAIVVLAVPEYAGIADRLGAPVPRVPMAVAAAAVCAAVAVPGARAETVIMGVVVLAGALTVAAGTPRSDSLSRVGAAVLGPLYIGLPIGALVAVHWQHGRETALLLVAVVAISDTAQYYAGRAFGRRPLAPTISPKKTVEGAIGGLLAGACAMAIIGAWWWPETPLALRALVGATVVVLGITGDLFESLLKRAAGLKDSSALIPGHGGVLDRIDALLFAAPVYFIVVRYVSAA